jgi:hypothetical protein
MFQEFISRHLCTVVLQIDSVAGTTSPGLASAAGMNTTVQPFLSLPCTLAANKDPSPDI